MSRERLSTKIKKSGGGHQVQKASFIKKLGANLDLSTITRSELVKLSGIKYHTASSFLLYTRPRIKMVALNNHVMMCLNNFNPWEFPGKPPTTAKEYFKYEARALKVAKKFGFSCLLYTSPSPRD